MNILLLMIFAPPQQAVKGFVQAGADTLKFNVTYQSVLIQTPKVSKKMKFRATRGRVVIDSVTLLTLDDKRVKLRFKDVISANSFSKEVTIPDGTPAFKEVYLELKVPGNARSTRPRLECWIFPVEE